MMKRLALAMTTIAAVSALVAGATFAYFTATGNANTATFTAGTVSLQEDAQITATVNNVAPGDSIHQSYKVTYTGSLDAWVGLDTSASGNLLTCEENVVANNMTISDGSKSYTQTGTNQLVGLFHQNDFVTFHLDGTIPTSVGNGCQNKSATFTWQVHAIQAKNNTNATNDAPNSWN